MPQIKSLQAFVAAVDTGSFMAAAEKLHTVQSNISAHIKKLEQELDASLLNRQKGVQLTAAGRQLLTHARLLLQQHQQLQTLFDGSNSSSAGSLLLGSMETTLAVRLPEVLAEFCQLMPSVDVQITAAPSADLMRALESGRIDAAFVAGRQPGDHWLQRPVFEETLVLISSQPMDQLPSATELSKKRFLAFRQGCTYRHKIELLLSHQGAYAPAVIELGSIDAILGCVAAGMGFALLPRSLVEQQGRFRLHCLELPAELGKMTTYLITPPEQEWSHPLRLFQSFFDEGNKGYSEAGGAGLL